LHLWLPCSDGHRHAFLLFAKNFLEALRSHGGRDGILTLPELYTYVERLKIQPRFGEFGGARMELSQTVLRAKERLFEAQVTVVLVDRKGKPKRLPPEMTKTFLSLVESNN